MAPHEFEKIRLSHKRGCSSERGYNPYTAPKLLRILHPSTYPKKTGFPAAKASSIFVYNHHKTKRRMTDVQKKKKMKRASHVTHTFPRVEAAPLALLTSLPASASRDSVNRTESPEPDGEPSALPPPTPSPPPPLLPLSSKADPMESEISTIAGGYYF